MTPAYEGGCHCGAVRITFATDRPLSPRACQCGFCRRHDARMVSDPEGSARLALGPEARRYRFGTRTTDYLFCGRCGIYVGAVAEIDGALYATLNLNAFEDARRDLIAAPVSYEGETAAGKAERRRRKWTPARLAEG
jgi:hypothetical protein